MLPQHRLFQGLPNYSQWVKNGLPRVFVNKVWLKQNHTEAFIYHPYEYLHATTAELNSCYRNKTNKKILLTPVLFYEQGKGKIPFSSVGMWTHFCFWCYSLFLAFFFDLHWVLYFNYYGFLCLPTPYTIRIDNSFWNHFYGSILAWLTLFVH